MTQAVDFPTPTGALAAQITTFAGPPALIAGESPADYDELHARVYQALRPSDIIEQIWIRDVVDLVWEVFRLRRLRANLMAAAAYQGMLQILEPLFDAPGSFAKRWARREESAVQRVEAALAKAGLTMDAVAAASFSARIGDFERLDRLMTAAEGRRNAALHELERHRAGFALRLRRTLQDVEDAEFKVISPVEPVGGEAA
jgi:hypothetical protein